MRLEVSFDSGMATLFKETRNLKWLGFDISFDLTLLARKVKDVYPVAVSLTEIIRTYTEMEGRLVDEVCNPLQFFVASQFFLFLSHLSLFQVRPLISSHKRDVQYHISKGFEIEWRQSAKLNPFMKNMTDTVTNYKNKVCFNGFKPYINIK